MKKGTDSKFKKKNICDTMIDFFNRKSMKWNGLSFSNILFFIKKDVLIREKQKIYINLSYFFLFFINRKSIKYNF